MLDFSITLFWLALGCSVAAFGAYAVAVAGLPAGFARAVAQTSAGNVVVGQGAARRADPRIARVGSLLTALTAALLTGAILARWNVIGHIPLSNMYEATLALAWGTCVVYLAFEQVSGQRRTGVVLLPIVAGFLGIAALFPSRVVPLIPALQNEPLLTIHVAAMIISYAVLNVAFAGAVIYLAQGGGERRRISWLPRADIAGEWAHKAVLVGFPALGLGIALGAWWANSAWGRYWGWDPKETSALMVWLSLVAYFHARATPGSVASAPGIRRFVPRAWRRGWRPDPMWWLVVMWLLVMFTYFIVNLWITGLHSYAGV